MQPIGHPARCQSTSCIKLGGSYRNSQRSMQFCSIRSVQYMCIEKYNFFISIFAVKHTNNFTNIPTYDKPTFISKDYLIITHPTLHLITNSIKQWLIERVMGVSEYNLLVQCLLRMAIRSKYDTPRWKMYVSLFMATISSISWWIGYSWPYTPLTNTKMLNHWGRVTHVCVD